MGSPAGITSGLPSGAIGAQEPSLPASAEARPIVAAAVTEAPFVSPGSQAALDQATAALQQRIAVRARAAEARSAPVTLAEIVRVEDVAAFGRDLALATRVGDLPPGVRRQVRALVEPTLSDAARAKLDGMTLREVLRVVPREQLPRARELVGSAWQEQPALVAAGVGLALGGAIGLSASAGTLGAQTLSLPLGGGLTLSGSLGYEPGMSNGRVAVGLSGEGFDVSCCLEPTDGGLRALVGDKSYRISASASVGIGPVRIDARSDFYTGARTVGAVSLGLRTSVSIGSSFALDLRVGAGVGTLGALALPAASAGVPTGADALRPSSADSSDRPAFVTGVGVGLHFE